MPDVKVEMNEDGSRWTVFVEGQEAFVGNKTQVEDYLDHLENCCRGKDCRSVPVLGDSEIQP